PPDVPDSKTDPQRYIRTTQNEANGTAPAKADFVSDRNTVAASKLEPGGKGSEPLPTMKGSNLPTLELANRDYQDGQIKNDSAPAPPMPRPEAAPSEPAPQEVAKKVDTPAEKMMR